MIQVKCDVQTRKAIPNSNLLGFETDNESNSIYFRVNPHISGTAEVYIERDQDTGYIVLDEASDSYYLPIKKSLVKQKGTVIMQLIITTSDEKVYTFDKITFEVKTSIKVDEEIPDEYPTWMEVGNARLAEFNEAIEDINEAIVEANEAIDDANQAIDDMNEVKDQILEDKEAGLFDGFSPIATVTETQSGATISITDVNGTTTADVLNGEKGDKGDTGASAKINGVNTLTIEAGENVALNQEDSTLTISATDTTDYTELTNKPSVNNVELNGNKTLAELGIKQSYTKSDVGLNNVDNIRQYSADNPPPYPVTSVNSLTGNVIIDTHDDLIPTQASSSNQLADKNFVNSSIATSTATFKGTYDSLAELEAVTADDNDYGFVVSVDSAGNTVYNRYKYSNDTWVFEYALNNSSFTQAQWAAIQSGITSDLVTKLQGIEEGAEANVIEGVEIANTLQSITGKIVKIEPDTTPIEDSTNVINSNAVYEIENMLPLGSTTGDIDNAQPYKVMSVSADGKYKQDSTTGKNLLPYNQLSEVTENGITFTPIYEGNNLLYVRAKGTATATVTYRFYGTDTTTPQKIFDSATKINFGLNGSSSTYGMVVWGLNSGGANIGTVIYSDTDYEAGFQLAGIGLRIISGTNVDIQFKPMIRLASITDDTYEPYTGGASPNPDYPQTITQVTSATWNRIGANWFSTNKLSTWVKRNDAMDITYSGTNEIIVSSTTTANYGYVYTAVAKLPAIAGKTYTISYNAVATNTITAEENFVKLNTNEVTPDNTLQGDTTITATQDFIWLYITLNKSSGTAPSVTLSNIKIVEDVDTAYSPYQGQTIPIDLDGNEVCSVGTIKDKVLVDRYGNCAIQKNVGKVVLNGSEYWNNDTTKTLTQVFSTEKADMSGLATKSNMFTYNLPGDAEKIAVAQNGIKWYIYIAILKTRASTVEELKTWLSTHNTTVYYALATPTIIPLPKLSILPSTLKGINHIWLDTNLGRTAIEVEYVKDLSLDIPTKVTDLSDESNYVKFTDYASTSAAGVAKLGNGFQVNSSTGVLSCVTYNYTDYGTKANSVPIAKGTLENVLTERIGTIETALTTLDVGGGVQ